VQASPGTAGSRKLSREGARVGEEQRNASMKLKSVCVFCGSHVGKRPEYVEAARDVGRLLGQRGVRLVYGGGGIGLMGALADAALAEGGEVIGVIPRMLLEKELGHGQVTELRVVASMHERKAMMADLADAFLALPGGIGTLEELCEILTWSQLGLHRKPCGILNTCGYFAGLLDMLTRAVDDEFLRPEHFQLFTIGESPADLLAAMERLEPLQLPKWIDRSAT
jgi:uncharacterized protein (TIGR00730 family)